MLEVSAVHHELKAKKLSSKTEPKVKRELQEREKKRKKVEKTAGKITLVGLLVVIGTIAGAYFYYGEFKFEWVIVGIVAVKFIAAIAEAYMDKELGIEPEPVSSGSASYDSYWPSMDYANPTSPLRLDEAEHRLWND